MQAVRWSLRPCTCHYYLCADVLSFMSSLYPVLQDTRLMKSAGTSSISVALRSVVVAIFGLVLMFITSVLLTALTLAILPILLLSFRWFAIVNKKYTAEQLTASAEASTVAEECFGSIRTVSHHRPVTTHRAMLLLAWAAQFRS